MADKPPPQPLPTAGPSRLSKGRTSKGQDGSIAGQTLKSTGSLLARFGPLNVATDEDRGGIVKAKRMKGSKQPGGTMGGSSTGETATPSSREQLSSLFGQWMFHMLQDSFKIHHIEAVKQEVKDLGGKLRVCTRVRNPKAENPNLASHIQRPYHAILIPSYEEASFPEQRVNIGSRIHPGLSDIAENTSIHSVNVDWLRRSRYQRRVLPIPTLQAILGLETKFDHKELPYEDIRIVVEAMNQFNWAEAPSKAAFYAAFKDQHPDFNHAIPNFCRRYMVVLEGASAGFRAQGRVKGRKPKPRGLARMGDEGAKSELGGVLEGDDEGDGASMLEVEEDEESAEFIVKGRSKGTGRNKRKREEKEEEELVEVNSALNLSNDDSTVSDELFTPTDVDDSVEEGTSTAIFGLIKLSTPISTSPPTTTVDTNNEIVSENAKVTVPPTQPQSSELLPPRFDLTAALRSVQQFPPPTALATLRRYTTRVTNPTRTFPSEVIQTAISLVRQDTAETPLDDLWELYDEYVGTRLQSTGSSVTGEGSNVLIASSRLLERFIDSAGGDALSNESEERPGSGYTFAAAGERFAGVNILDSDILVLTDNTVNANVILGGIYCIFPAIDRMIVILPKEKDTSVLEAREFAIEAVGWLLTDAQALREGRVIDDVNVWEHDIIHWSESDVPMIYTRAWLMDTILRNIEPLLPPEVGLGSEPRRDRISRCYESLLHALRQSLATPPQDSQCVERFWEYLISRWLESD